MLHISPEHLKIVRDIFLEQIPETPVYVFGSRSTGNNLKEFSDLDLYIDSDTISDTEIANLQIEFSDSNLPFRVEITTPKDVSDEFFQIIKNDLKII